MHKKKPKTIEPYEMERYGILNHAGQIWTPETFDTPEKAQEYIERWQMEVRSMDLSRHTVIPVMVTVQAVQQPTT